MFAKLLAEAMGEQEQQQQQHDEIEQQRAALMSGSRSEVATAFPLSPPAVPSVPNAVESDLESFAVPEVRPDDSPSLSFGQFSDLLAAEEVAPDASRSDATGSVPQTFVQVDSQPPLRSSYDSKRRAIEDVMREAFSMGASSSPVRNVIPSTHEESGNSAELPLPVGKAEAPVVESNVLDSLQEVLPHVGASSDLDPVHDNPPPKTAFSLDGESGERMSPESLGRRSRVFRDPVGRGCWARLNSNKLPVRVALKGSSTSSFLELGAEDDTLGHAAHFLLGLNETESFTDEAGFLADLLIRGWWLSLEDGCQVFGAQNFDVRSLDVNLAVPLSSSHSRVNPAFNANPQIFSSFAQAYAYLAQRSPAVRESLVQTERAYAQAGMDLRLQLAEQRQQLAAAQEREMQVASDASDSSSISVLVAKHVYDVERLQKAHHRELEALGARQKMEFAQFVMQFAAIEGQADTGPALLAQLEQQQLQLSEAQRRRRDERQKQRVQQETSSGSKKGERRSKKPLVLRARRRDALFGKRKGEAPKWQPQPAPTRFKTFGGDLRQELEETMTVLLNPQERLPEWCLRCQVQAPSNQTGELIRGMCVNCGFDRKETGDLPLGFAGCESAGLPSPPPFCNVRVTRAPLLSVCSTERKEEHQLMASALYSEGGNSGSDGGSGAIFLVVDPQLRCYSGLGSAVASESGPSPIVGATTATGFAELCSSSTEFHFDTFNEQLTAIRRELNDSHAPELQTGDFFITQHSNLCNVHVAFHVIGEASVVAGARETGMVLSADNLLLKGLRRALRAAMGLGVGFVALPALMLAGAGAENMVSAEAVDVQQRAAAVVASVAEFLREEPVHDLTSVQITLPGIPGVDSLQIRLREQLKAEFPDLHTSSWIN